LYGYKTISAVFAKVVVLDADVGNMWIERLDDTIAIVFKNCSCMGIGGPNLKFRDSRDLLKQSLHGNDIAHGL
jgi:hypothetical protein